jgi:hypothetical protein
VILSASGIEESLVVNAAEAERVAVDHAERRDAFNALAASGASDAQLANPSPDACTGCAFRVACDPFHSLWSDAWSVGRGVRGVLQEQRKHGATWEVQVEGTSPSDLIGMPVRVSGLPAATSAAPGESFAAFGTDIMGSLTAQRARWSTRYWPPLVHTGGRPSDGDAETRHATGS